MLSHIRSLIQLMTARRRPSFNISLLTGLLVCLACSSASALDSGSGYFAESIDFKLQPASAEVIRIANWVVESRDNKRLPFLIIDKINARVFVFDAKGNLMGADAALLGMGRGDRHLAVLENQRMSSIKPEDRITPAGRYVVSLQRDIHGKEVLLIDYNASIALHAVVKGTPAERRAERLKSASAADNRISYGCINVPVQFYTEIVSPAFTKTNGVVYILPETSSANKMFGLPAEGKSP